MSGSIKVTLEILEASIGAACEGAFRWMYYSWLNGHSDWFTDDEKVVRCFHGKEKIWLKERELKCWLWNFFFQ